MRLGLLERPLCAAIFGLLVFGCGKGSQRSAENPSGAVQRRDTELAHEECDLRSSDAERIDANGDGKADVTLVRESGREVCRAVDLNFDGLVDTWVYREPSGQVRRRESDYDRDGRIDEISLYQGGVLVARHSSTTLAHRIDTWQFFEGGVLRRAERDSDGDTIIDQWWEYPTPDCPLMHADITGDGRPDLGASIDYCKETGYVPPRRAQARGPAAPDFSEQTSMPTEVETKPMPEAPGAGESGAPKPGPEGKKP
ncbi:MAG TPA: hypothetical protein VF989_21180 [Polyangiaceae bacterium]